MTVDMVMTNGWTMRAIRHDPARKKTLKDVFNVTDPFLEVRVPGEDEPIKSSQHRAILGSIHPTSLPPQPSSRSISSH